MDNNTKETDEEVKKIIKDAEEYFESVKAKIYLISKDKRKSVVESIVKLMLKSIKNTSVDQQVEVLKLDIFVERLLQLCDELGTPSEEEFEQLIIERAQNFFNLPENQKKFEEYGKQKCVDISLMAMVDPNAPEGTKIFSTELLRLFNEKKW